MHIIYIIYYNLNYQVEYSILCNVYFWTRSAHTGFWLIIQDFQVVYAASDMMAS